MLLFYQCYSYFNVLAYDMLQSTSTRKFSINLSLKLSYLFYCSRSYSQTNHKFQVSSVRQEKKIGNTNYINSFKVMLAEFSLLLTVSVVAIYSSLNGLAYHFRKQRGIRRTR